MGAVVEEPRGGVDMVMQFISKSTTPSAAARVELAPALV